MKRIRTMFNCIFGGYYSIKELNKIRAEYNRIAIEEQSTMTADHRVYAMYEYDTAGELVAANFYRGVSKTDAEYEDVAALKNVVIYAIHAPL